MNKKNAIVTGAGSGIGREVAKRLAARGLRVYAIGRNEPALEETVQMIGASGEAQAVKADVTDYDVMKKVFDEIGPVSVFIANAGVCEQASLKDSHADEVFNKTMSTNVKSVWNSFRLLEPRFDEGGSAVVVSSGLGKLGRAGYGAYTASKHAVIGLVKCFAKELAEKGITVNAVCPGWVDTEMAQNDLVVTAKAQGSTPDEIKKQALEGIPLKRFVKAEEVAALIDWLTSDQAKAITGQAYNISCGEFFA